MAARSVRLRVVLDMALREEEAVQVRLAAALNDLGKQEARLNDLISYQKDYVSQLSGQRTTGVRTLQTLHQYLAQIADAMRGQEQRIAHAKLMVDKVRHEWRLAHEKRRGMERFIEECQRQERQASDRVEQKLSDELAQRPRRH